jgi:hypothetical protein
MGAVEQEFAKERMNFIDGLGIDGVGHFVLHHKTIAALQIGEHPPHVVIAGEPLGLPGRDAA